MDTNICMGVLEADDIKQQEMKGMIRKEYVRRVRNILKSKLNGRNVLNAMNSRAVLLIRYGAGILNCTKTEAQELDWKTRHAYNL